MSEIAATTVHEAYAFACMRCGYGWEQAYEIEHHVDTSNHAFVVYKADGERVPSPLSTPTCTNCGGHVVRIMRAGRVSTVQQLLQNRRPAVEADADAEVREPVAATAAPSGDHHWHLSDLLHPFHRK
ncbi:hypothetical protein [Streptomyces sp. BE230]|uniref:hypothetical protein n=1 Tax=Streptomyces sp. BE230 TaxID=3002526 RepID=UPI002ED367CE|nr:hypothetical protein [Streptomyces sp. BE230]